MAKAVSPPYVYTVEEFAAIFRLSPDTVRRRIRKGEISAAKIGRHYRIPRQVVARLYALAASPAGPGFGMWNGKSIKAVKYADARRDAERRSADELLASLTLPSLPTGERIKVRGSA